jgi:SAM-dependent methyltransferase
MRALLHNIVSHPAVYDLVQTLVGAKALRRRLGELAAGLPTPNRVVDIGGGTGELQRLWPVGTTYICLDIDMEKLRGFRSKSPQGAAVRGDATRAPLADGSVDLVICTAVSHHLDDAQWPLFLAETRRILRPGGHLLFMDAVWSPRRLPGRVLWHYDRGSHPRTIEFLRHSIAEHLSLVHFEEKAILHRYIFCVARRA